MAVVRAWAGAAGDVFGPLRGLALISLAASATLLAGLVYLALRFGLPLIPEGAGWWATLSTAGEALAGGVAIVLAIALIPVVAMIIGGALFDVAAERVEKQRFPGDPAGRFVAPHEGVLNGLRIAGPALLLNLLALPLLFVPVVNVVAFTALNAFLMGREYFSLAALRFGDWARVRELRKRHGGAIFAAALLPALLLLVPVVNFLTPLFGAALMVRLHKALTR